MNFDVFVSHASEDKVDVVRPLVTRLQALGLRVWFDEFELTLGDSLRRTIDKGLSQSRFGIVVLSPDFLKKEWPNKELDALVSREDGKDKVILPIWHNVDRTKVVKYSPLLADKLAVSTENGIDTVANKVFEAVNKRPYTPTEASSPVSDLIGNQVSRIRRDLLQANTRTELNRLRYEAEEILHKSPSHVEAKMILDQIGSVLRHQTTPHSMPQQSHSWYISSSRTVLVTMAIAVVAIPMLLPLQRNTEPSEAHRNTRQLSIEPQSNNIKVDGANNPVILNSKDVEVKIGDVIINPPTKEPTVATFKDIGRTLYVLYKPGLVSNFNQKPDKETTDGYIYNFQQPEVELTFRHSIDDPATLIYRRWLELSHRNDDYRIAHCTEDNKRVFAARESNSNCESANDNSVCIKVWCE